MTLASELDSFGLSCKFWVDAAVGSKGWRLPEGRKRRQSVRALVWDFLGLARPLGATWILKPLPVPV